MHELTPVTVSLSRDCSQITLREVFEDYKASRHLKPATLKNYTQRLGHYLGDWMDKPIANITKNMCEERHAEIKGDATANSTFRTLRALLHYAAIKYELEDGAPVIKNNPVRRLSELRIWHKDKRRKSVIPISQVGRFFKAVWTLENHTARDYLLTLMLTGLRSHEAACLKWEQVDLQTGTITVLAGLSKNGEEHLIPMSDYLWKLINMRKLSTNSAWVFPGKHPSKHIVSLNKSYKAVMDRSGLKFCLHDLRRGYVSIGDELEIKSGVIKQLVNHKNEDITESYTIRATERLRRATQLITDRILAEAKSEAALISTKHNALPSEIPLKAISFVKPKEKLSPFITFGQLLLKYCIDKNVSDLQAYNFRRQLMFLEWHDEPVVKITDDLIDKKTLELKEQKLDSTIAIIKALSMYARFEGLFEYAPKELDLVPMQ